MFTSPSSICPPAQNFHRLRKTAVLLAFLILIAALSSCGRNAAPADEIPPGQARSSACAQREQAALIALYNATGGLDWYDNSNWLSQKPFSTWFGVTTASNGCVTRLDLQNNNLTGSIPPDLGSLPMLQSLDLRNNNLAGPIPPELANASNLERLFLAPNNFTGCIPRQLAHLENFSRSTSLTGSAGYSSSRLHPIAATSVTSTSTTASRIPAFPSTALSARHQTSLTPTRAPPSLSAGIRSTAPTATTSTMTTPSTPPAAYRPPANQNSATIWPPSSLRPPTHTPTPPPAGTTTGLSPATAAVVHLSTPRMPPVHLPTLPTDRVSIIPPPPPTSPTLSKAPP